MVSLSISRFAFAASPARPGAAKIANTRIDANSMRMSDIVSLLLLVDLGDLRALDAGPRHQAPLVEDEGVDVARERRAGDRFGDTLVDDHDAWTDADLETSARVEIVQRLVRHEEERVAERLQAGLQTFGYALFFMTDEALNYLDASGGFEIGVGPSIVIVDQGIAKSITSSTLASDVYAFIFDQRGLMAGAGIQGSKITKIDK